MIRVRFHANLKDARPINWPVKHPFWFTGYGEDYTVVVAYADHEAYIYENWPEATNLDVEEVAEYVFTDRFQKPDWL